LNLCANAQSSGGGTTVGDGGHVILCNGKYELFDLFENRINSGKPSAVSLASGPNSTLNDMIQTGLARIQRRFLLNEKEMYRVERATKMFRLNSQTMVSIGWPYDGGLSANDLLVSAKVASNIRASDCRVELAAIRPPINSFFEPICRNNLSELEYCFIIDSELTMFLNREQKACLILHESLRFLPDTKRLSEAQLRLTTSQICTE
jgi:hypothetical protein